MTPETFTELRARVLDATLDREQRLLAFWRLSAAHWRARMSRIMHAEAAEPDDKIVIARRNHYQAQLVRSKAERMAAGKQLRKITGRMAAIENGDEFYNAHCDHCGAGFRVYRPFKGRAPRYCSGACRQAMHRLRAAA